MAVGSGRGTSVGHGKETTYGTATARTNWMHAFSIDLQEKPEISPIPVLCQGDNVDFSDHYTARVAVAGSVSFPLLFEGFGFWMEAAFGTPAVTGGAGPHTHTYERGSTVQGLTVEVIRGSTGQSEVLNGVVVTGWTMMFEVGQIARFDATLLGQKANAVRGPAPMPTYGGTVTGRAVRHDQVGSIGYDSSTYVAQRIEVVVETTLERLDELGSLYTSQPEASDFGTVRVRATVVHRNDDLYNDLRGNTQGDLTITITGSGNNVIAITGRNAVVVSADEPINNAGVITQTVEWLVLSDTSDSALRAIWTNDQATATTN